LAAFVGKEDALLFSTGYQTSQGVIQPLVKRNDTIFSDKDNHASIQTGNFVARGSTGTNIIRYKHCSIEDLEMKLAKLPIEAGKFIVTDGVFSTFGNIADMQKITALAKKYNAKTLVDDAHSFGVLGEGGRGTSSEFNVTNDVDLIMCTFSKTLASLGGFVAGEERVINYLKHHSPALIFSASPTPPSVAAAIAALDIVQQEPERVQRLVNNAEFVRSGLKDAGFNVIDGRTAIVPVLIGDNKQAFGLWKGLFDEGIFVNVFIPPATPPNKSMMRNSFMATHKKEHLEKVVDCYTKIGKRLGII
jgi:8-amino-7-oxononanoate synthase